MANKYIDRIKYSDTYFLQDSGATHDSSHNLSGTTGDFSAASITADSGIFKFLKVEDELVANKATVVGLLDVKGELHTNKWTSTNIANIGGSFYISPTYKSSSANLQFGGTANSRSITVSSGAFGSDSASGLAITAWSTGSKVMMTGSVTYNNTTYPLGTCDGTLSGAMTASGFTINGVSSDAVETLYEIIGTNQATAADIEISMRVIGGTNPVGILLTSFGVSQSTYIDIYGGTNANVGTPTVPNAEPNLRIGYLGDGTNNYGLQKLGGDSEYPKSWGIYTTNGYFKGRIVADSGKIGGTNGWSIATDVLYSGSHSTYNADSDGIFLGKSTETGNPYYVAGGPHDGSTTNPLWYLKSDGSAKIGAMTLSSSGILSVPAANVSGALTAATISADKITTGTINANILTANNITTGTITMGTANTDSYVYISKTGSTLTINSESKSWYLVLGKSFGVTNAGYLSAASGKIGGWTISADRLSIETIGSSGGIMISPSNTTSYTINGATRTNLRLAIGTKFGVDKDGNLYANGANITNINGSNITANTLSVNAFPSTTQQQILNAGRNLVWDSEWKDIPNKWSDWGSPTTREIVTINGKRWLHLVTTTTAFQGYQQNEDKRNGDNEIQAGDKITVSYYAYAATAGQQATVGVHWRDSSNTIVGQNWTTNAVTTTATRYTATYTVPSTAVSFNVMVGDNTSSAQQLWISQVKLEKGESATEWAAALEDVPTGYITQINNGGIKIHDINDNSNFIQITSGGMTVYKGGTDVATFGTTTRIGAENGNHVVTDSNGTTISTYDGNTLVDVFKANSSGTSQSVKLTQNAWMKYLTQQIITLNGTPSGTLSCSYGTNFTFTYGTASTKSTTYGSVVYNGAKKITVTNENSSTTRLFSVTYTATVITPYFDLGTRISNPYPFSTIIGEGLITNYNNQVAIGKYNIAKAGELFIIGNGTVGNSSNAFEVDVYGDVMAPCMAGQIIMTGCPAGGPGSSTLVPANNTTVYEPILGWLICNGAAVSRTTYAALFAVIGTTYGTGNGSTTFNLPDLRGRAPIGAGTGSGLTARTLGTTVGVESVTLTGPQSGVQAHAHGTNTSGKQFVTITSGTSIGSNRPGSSGTTTNYFVNTSSSDNPWGRDTNTANATAKSATTAHTNMQPSAVVNFIICTGLLEPDVSMPNNN